MSNRPTDHKLVSCSDPSKFEGLKKALEYFLDDINIDSYYSIILLRCLAKRNKISFKMFYQDDFTEELVSISPNEEDYKEYRDLEKGNIEYIEHMEQLLNRTL